MQAHNSTTLTPIWVVILLVVVGGIANAQTTDSTATSRSKLTLGFAVDTTMVPASWWGVDPARAALPAVVRTWRDYLAVRANPSKRVTFWSSADRRRFSDPDLSLVTEGYIVGASSVLVEALPVVAGDSTRWLLRTLYIGGGSPTRPGVLGMERMYVVREAGRWVLEHPSISETATWHRERVGLIEYVVHPTLRFDRARAAETTRWAVETARRFGVTVVAPITYYQVPDLQAAFRVMGLDLALSADRVGGRANPTARVVFAADPRFAEAYRHELVHVLLQSVAGGRSAFVGEGIAYWLGGARGQPFAVMLRDLASYLDRHPAIDLRQILSNEGSEAAASARLPAAAAVFELVYRGGGDAAVLHLINSLGKQEPSLDALAGASGIAPAQLEASWRAVIRTYARAGRDQRL